MSVNLNVPKSVNFPAMKQTDFMKQLAEQSKQPVRLATAGMPKHDLGSAKHNKLLATGLDKTKNLFSGLAQKAKNHKALAAIIAAGVAIASGVTAFVLHNKAEQAKQIQNQDGLQVIA